MSNSLGEIYGTLKDGKSCIKINSDLVDITGDLNLTGAVSVGGRSRVYFSVQLGSNAQSFGGTSRYMNHLNELQSNVPINTRGLAGYSDTWDISGMVSSHDQTNFATNGYIVPRTGVYKIDCYQTIKSTYPNSGNAGLRVYRNPTVSYTQLENENYNASQYYQNSQCLASSEEGENNPHTSSQGARRSESVVWLGQLTQGDAIKFMITCDNGFGPMNNDSSSLKIHKSCYTIVSVDDDALYFNDLVGQSVGFRATSASTSHYVPAQTPGTGTLFSHQLTNTNGFRGQFINGFCFNTSTGLFTAPTAGMYYFHGVVTWHTHSFSEGYLAIMITTPDKILNSNSLLVTQHGGNEVFNDNFPQTIDGVLQLAAGDQIGLYTSSWSGGSKIMHNYTTFGGHMISSTVTSVTSITTKHHGSMTFMPGTSITTRTIVKENVTENGTNRAPALNFDTNNVYYTTDTEFEPVYGMAAKYTPVGVTVHTDQMVDTNGNNVSFSGGHPSRFRIARSGYYRLVVNLTLEDKTDFYRKNLMMFRRSGSNTANGYRVGTTSDLIGVQIQFKSNEHEVVALIFNDICELNEGDEVYPCFHMNQNGIDCLYIDMNTYFNIEEI